MHPQILKTNLKRIVYQPLRRINLSLLVLLRCVRGRVVDERTRAEHDGRRAWKGRGER